MPSKFKIVYSPGARKDLLKLEKSIARRIVIKLGNNIKQANPLLRAKKLSGFLEGRYRYRIGDYRIIFGVDENKRVSILKILTIRHRKDVYRK